MRASCVVASLAILVGGCDSRPGVIAPEGLDAVDPLVRTHVEQLLVRARDEDSREALVELGLGLLANGFAEEARATFGAAANRGGDEPLLGLYSGLAAIEASDQELAKRDFSAVMKTWPGFVAAQERLGWLLLEEGRLDEAESLFATVAELAAGEPAGHLGLAEVSLQRGAAQPALELVEGWPASWQRFGPVIRLKSRALRALGRLEEARALPGVGAASARPHITDPWAGRLRQHQRGLAELMDRATGLRRSGEGGAATQLLEEIRAVHPENFEVAVNLAVAYLTSDRSEEAFALLSPEVEANPDRFEGHLNLAAIELQRLKLEAALASAARAVELAPSVAQAHRTLSRVFEKMGRQDEALAAIEEAARREPGSAVLVIEVGRVALRADRPERAEPACRKVIEWTPQALAGPLCLGEALRRQGRLAEAQRALEAARAITPNHPDVAKLAKRLDES